MVEVNQYGWKVGDKGILLSAQACMHGSKAGDIVTLTHDDGTYCPEFTHENGEECYIRYTDMMKVPKTAQTITIDGTEYTLTPVVKSPEPPPVPTFEFGGIVNFLGNTSVVIKPEPDHAGRIRVWVAGDSEISYCPPNLLTKVAA